MKNGFSTVFAVTAASLGALAVAAAGCGKPKAAAAKPAVVATLNGVPISMEEFALEWNVVRGTAGGIAPLGEASARALKRDLLDRIIERRLALASARGRFEIGAGDIKQEIAEMRSGYSDENFNEAMVNGLMTQETLERRVGERLAVDRFFQTEVFGQLSAGEDEVERYVREHAAEFDRPDKVRALHIVVRTEEEMNGVRERLKAGEEFGDLARRFSAGVEAKNGGALRPYARGDMPQVFDAAFDIGAGETSRVLASPYGYHLLKVVEKIPAVRVTPAQAASEARLKVLEQKKRAARAGWIAKARAVAAITINSEALDAIP